MLILAKKIAQWGDPTTPPQSRSECNSWASGDWPWGGGWKTCTGWKTEWRHMEVEAFLDFTGPDNLEKDIHKAIVDCAIAAAVGAAVAGVVTDGAGAAAGAQTAFVTCLKLKGVQELDKYSVAFRTESHWTDWS